MEWLLLAQEASGGTIDLVTVLTSNVTVGGVLLYWVKTLLDQLKASQAETKLANEQKSAVEEKFRQFVEKSMTTTVGALQANTTTLDALRGNVDSGNEQVMQEVGTCSERVGEMTGQLGNLTGEVKLAMAKVQSSNN